MSAPPRIPKKLNVSVEPEDTIPVTLVGKDYQVRRPKAWLSMRMALVSRTEEVEADKVMEVLEQWIAAVFRRNANAVIKRLDDPKDDLDVDHIMALVAALSEQEEEDDRPTS